MQFGESVQTAQRACGGGLGECPSRATLLRMSSRRTKDRPMTVTLIEGAYFLTLVTNNAREFRRGPALHTKTGRAAV